MKLQLIQVILEEIPESYASETNYLSFSQAGLDGAENINSTRLVDHKGNEEVQTRFLTQASFFSDHDPSRKKLNLRATAELRLT